MRHRVITNASALFSGIAVLMVTVGVSPAVAYPPVEQRSAVTEGSQVLDPTDYGPKTYSSSGSGSSIYGGGNGNSSNSSTSNGAYGGAPKSASRPAASAPASGQWEIYNQLQQLQEEVQQLRGMVEQQNFEIEQLRKQQRETYRDLDMRIGRGGGSSAAAPATSGGSVAVTPETGEASVASGASAPASEASADDKQTYAQALENVKSKQFSKAISQLESLLTSSPGSQLAPNCHYWLGELYMVNDPADYDKAKAHFQDLLKNHADNPKVPDALYKLGKLSALKGDRDRAKVYFDRVIKEFPDAQAAVLAKDYLKRL